VSWCAPKACAPGRVPPLTPTLLRHCRRQTHPLGYFLGKIWTNLGEIWAKVIKIWASLIRFGQNQNLAYPKTLDLLQLCRNLTSRKSILHFILITCSRNSWRQISCWFWIVIWNQYKKIRLYWGQGIREKSLIACLHDQNKSGFFWKAGLFLANQSFLITFRLLWLAG